MLLIAPAAAQVLSPRKKAEALGVPVADNAEIPTLAAEGVLGIPATPK